MFAVSVAWSPISMPWAAPLICTDWTYGATVTVARETADFPPADAVIPATPAPTAFTSPFGDTVATDGLVEVQVVIHPPAGGVPVVVSVATMVLESPTTRPIEVGATAIPVTADGPGVDGGGDVGGVVAGGVVAGGVVAGGVAVVSMGAAGGLAGGGVPTESVGGVVAGGGAVAESVGGVVPPVGPGPPAAVGVVVPV
jgi:hypothetical protein